MKSENNNTLDVIRGIDELGRVMVPEPMWAALDIPAQERGLVHISLADDAIIIKKATASCAFCGNPEPLVTFHGKCICKECCQSLHDQNSSRPKSKETL